MESVTGHFRAFVSQNKRVEQACDSLKTISFTTAKIGAVVLLHSATFGIATIAVPTIIRAKTNIDYLHSLSQASDGTEFSKMNKLSKMLDIVRNRVSSDKRINESSECRYDAKIMIKYLCDRHGAAAVRETLETLKQGDLRFNKQDKRFEFDSNELDNALNSISGGNSPAAGSRASANMLNPVDDEDRPISKMSHDAAVTKDITDELVAFVVRRPIEVEIQNPSEEVEIQNASESLVQGHGHIEKQHGVAFFVSGMTPSAELPNAKEGDILPNQASITYKKTDGTAEVVMCRSGRTDTKDKIEKKSQGDIYSRFEASEGEGDNCLRATKDENGKLIYEYRRVDTTLMDTSVWKSGYTLVRGFIMNQGSEIPVESERVFVANKKKAIAKIWSLKGNGEAKVNVKGVYIEHQIEYEGEIKTVREYKPIVNRYVFSGQSQGVWGPSNLQAAREGNRDSTLTMGCLLNKIKRDEENSELEAKLNELAEKFQQYQTAPSATQLKELTTALEGFNAEEFEGEETNGDAAKVAIHIDGLYASLTGKVRGNTGESIDTVEGAAQQLMYASLLADAVGLAKGAECKSGNDRTIEAVAITCAQREYSVRHPEKPFDPQKIVKQSDLIEFKVLFVKYVIALGAPNVAASRGIKEEADKPILKTATHPIFNFFAKDNGESVTSEGQTVEDVVNLI